MSFVLPEGRERSDYIKRKFTRIAGGYDLFNDLITLGMHRRWKGILTEKAGVGSGSRVLDICCGTGDISRKMRAKVGDKGICVGLDFSEGMLEIAKSRKETAGILFVQGDAIELPFRNDSFDSVSIGYGLRNLSDINRGLQEAIRVLKPGGRFLCLDVGKIRLPAIKQLFKLYFFSVVPAIGKRIYPGEDLFDYLPQSSVPYPSQESLAEKLRELGFGEVQFFNFLFGGGVIHYAEKPKAGPCSKERQPRR